MSFCVVCQDAISADDTDDALECLTCTQRLHEDCYNTYSEHVLEREDGQDEVACPSCRCTVTMQAVKHRQWVPFLNIIHVIRQRAELDIVTDPSTVSQVLAVILTSMTHSSVVITYACKCVYAISVGNTDVGILLTPEASRAIGTALTAFPDDNELALWACAALHTLAFNVLNNVAAVLPAIIAAMQRHSDVVIIAYYATMAFRVVAARDTTTIADVTRLCVAPALHSCRRHANESPLLNKALAWLVLTLSAFGSCKQQLASLGCIEAVMDIANTAVDSDDTMLYAVSALGNLMYADVANTDAARCAGVVRCMFEVLRRVHVADVVVEACDTLRNVLAYSTAPREVVCEIKLLHGMMRLTDVWTRFASENKVVHAVAKTILRFQKRDDVGFDSDVVDALRPLVFTAMAAYDPEAAEPRRPINTLLCARLLDVTAVLPYRRDFCYGAWTTPVLNTWSLLIRHLLDDDLQLLSSSRSFATQTIAAICDALCELAPTSAFFANPLVVHAGVVLTIDAAMLCPVKASTALRCIIEHTHTVEFVRRVFQRSAVMAKVAELLHDDEDYSVDALQFALNVLCLACDTPKGVGNVMTHARRIVMLLRTWRSNTSVLHNVCHLLILLLTTDVRRGLLNAAGATVALVDVLKDQTVPPSVAVVTARALGSLCCISPSRKSAALIGAVPILIDRARRAAVAVTTGSSLLVQQCVRALAQILAVADDATDNAVALLHCGGISVLNSIMDTTQCSRTLSHACVVLQAATAVSEDARGIILTGARLVAALYVSDTVVCRRAAAALEAFAKSTCVLHLLADDRYLLACNAVMRRSMGDTTLCMFVSSALECMLAVASSSKHCSPSVASALVQTLVTTLRRQVTDIEVVRSVCCALVSLGDLYAGVFCAENVNDAVFDACVMHADDETVFCASYRAAGIVSRDGFTRRLIKKKVHVC